MSVAGEPGKGQIGDKGDTRKNVSFLTWKTHNSVEREMDGFRFRLLFIPQAAMFM